jgi:uncharacterized membrane protein YfcA
MATTRAVRPALLVVLLALCLCAMCNPNLSFHDESLKASPTLHVPNLLTLLLGLVIGCYGTIVGIGGGPLIVPVLLFFYRWPIEDIVASSLLIVFLNALSGSVGYASQRRIDYKGGLAFSFAAMPGAVVSGFVHHLIAISIFDTIFGIFLLGLAGYTLARLGRVDSPLRRARPGPGSRRVSIVDRFRQRHEFFCDDRLGISTNFALGFLAGFLGIGGGVFQVPILIFLLGYPTHIATATSHFITMLTALFALTPGVLLGNVHFGETLWFGLGVVIGAQAGAKVASRLRSRAILALFAAILVVFSMRLLTT